jgi:hypothetical protein
LPSPQLLLPGTRVGSAVKIQTGDSLSGDPVLLRIPVKRIAFPLRCE